MRRYRIVDRDLGASVLSAAADVRLVALADDDGGVFGYVRADRAQGVVDTLNADVVVPIEEGHARRPARRDPGERISVEMAASTVRAGIACALAEALMVGIDECESEGVPLSQVQRTYLARGSIMAFDEAGRSGDALSTWSSLERLRMAGR